MIRDRLARTSARGPVGATRRIGLNLTPMIDVVFQLLIYFLLATSLAMDEELLAADLPQRPSPTRFAIDDEPVTVEIAAATVGRLPVTVRGPIAFSAASAGELRRRVREAISGPSPLLAPSHRFVLKPVPGARWDDAIEAFNALAGAGATRIVFHRETGR